MGCKILVVLFVLLGVQRTEAQSTLEYATLTGAVTAAAEAQAGKKDKKTGLTGALTEVQEGGVGAMGRAGGLMGQVGAGMAAPQIMTAPEPAVPKEIAVPSEPAPAEETAPVEPGNVRVLLKNGRVIEGVLVERAPDHVRIETGGVEVTFFTEEISKIDA